MVTYIAMCDVDLSCPIIFRLILSSSYEIRQLCKIISCVLELESSYLDTSGDHRIWRAHAFTESHKHTQVPSVSQLRGKGSSWKPAEERIGSAYGQFPLREPNMTLYHMGVTVLCQACPWHARRQHRYERPHMRGEYRYEQSLGPYACN